MVLPAQEPLGALMPDVLQLLGDPVQSPPRLRHLVTSTGEVLDVGATLADKQIPDGAVLRLVRADEPLPAPVVHEVPEVVGDALQAHLWRWGPGAMRWSSTLTVVALSFAIGVLIKNDLGDAAGLGIVGGFAALLLVSGMVLGAAWREPLGSALSLAGGAAAGVAIWYAADLYDWPAWARWGGITLLTGLIIAALGLASPLGRGGLIGGGLAVLLAAIGGGCAAAGLNPARTGAVLAVVCVVVLSLLLRVALTLSGLTSLDDRRGAGAAVTRSDVMSALAGAHRSMVIATLAVAVAATVAGLGAATQPGGWAAGLGVLLVLVVAGRARLFPLVLEKVALFAAAVVIVIGLAWRWAEHETWGVAPALGMLLAGMVIPVVALTTDPPEHVRARLRRLMNRVEAVCVVAIIPVAIGTFGTFERLLETF